MLGLAERNQYDRPQEHRFGRIEPNKSSSDTVASESEWAMTALYRHAKHRDWDDVLKDCERAPSEARFVCPADGTTALHLAVMSRTGYSIDDNSKHTQSNPAPLAVVEKLLQVYPEAAKMVCEVNSYTPLHYGCLVPGPDFLLEDSDTMVRLFLKYCPESTSVYTAGGLSCLDVHIVSYSRAHGKDQEGSTLLGRTSTVVLRTLLESNPSLAKVRIFHDKVGGPIELLYRCNSQQFLKLAAMYEKKKERSPEKKRGQNEEKSNSVLAQITNWWGWIWTVLILKYGTLPHKKKGARFFAVQAAAGLVGCPVPVLTLALSAFPEQIRERDEMHGNAHNLPLHEVCAWPCEQDSASSDPVISSRKSMAISALLQAYPEAAFVCNRDHMRPLDLAVKTGTTWDGGVRKLVRANPAAVSLSSIITAADLAQIPEGWEPPLTSPNRSVMKHLKNMAKKDLQSVRLIYGLLRVNPSAIEKGIPQDEEDYEGGWADFSGLTST